MNNESKACSRQTRNIPPPSSMQECSNLRYCIKLLKVLVGGGWGVGPGMGERGRWGGKEGVISVLL